MSIPPEPVNLKTKLEALLALSQEFESYDDFELSLFQKFVDAREQLLSEIQHANNPEAGTDPQISELIAAIQEVDERVSFRLERERAEQARELRGMSQVKNVLGAYKFPTINTSTGVENQG